MGQKEKLSLLMLKWGILIGMIISSEDYLKEREEMVKFQIEERGIKDTLVLNAMRKVERHKFVPSEYRRWAYSDRPLPIGYEQTISQPYIVALMTSLLQLKGGERILEIGTGSGYQAAILGEIVKEVYTIEIIKPLAENAEKKLKQLGYTNIKVKHGDGYQGWEEYAPFDGIIITCAPPKVPQPLIDQLKIGGKLVVPLGEIYQELIVITKMEKGIKKESIIPVQFVPMRGKIEKE
jgi:protein-L-isoaspartate(D-aspartate) O-methyltransferase